MMKRVIKLYGGVILILVLIFSGCVHEKKGELPVQSPEETRAASIVRISDILGNIISRPDQYLDKQVEIVGYYHGWDLLKEVQGTPPVTRSDWVIADNSGAIYVTGMAPHNLDPASVQDTNQVVHLVATVEQNQTGMYLRAISVVVISSE